jgi:hypothetical protein
VLVQLRLLYAVVRREREEQAVPATHDGAIAEAQIHAEPRRDVVRVVGQIAWQPGPELQLLGMGIRVDVVPQTEVEREPVAHSPVVLHPCGKDVSCDEVLEVLVRQSNEHARGDRRQGRQVPRGVIVPDGEQRLYVGGHGKVARVDLAHAAEAPAELVVESHVFAAELHVVPATPVVRGGEIVTYRLRILENVQRVRADCQAP